MSTPDSEEDSAERATLKLLFAGSDWSSVLQGLELAASLDPDFVSVFCEGVSISDEGEIVTTGDWIKQTGVRPSNRDNAALLALSLRPGEGLAKAERLKLIDLENLSDVRPLSTAAALSDLQISNCPELDDLSPLSELASLRRLSVSACANGARLPRFGPSTGVERLALSGLSCRDLSELGHLTELVSLGLHSITGLADLNALSACSRLSRLRINQCRGLGDLRPLAALSSLSWLDIEGPAGISDLSPLSGLVELEELRLADLQFDQQGIRPLGPLKKLHTLDLGGSRLTGFDTLLDFPLLESLVLPKEAVFDDVVEGDKSSLLKDMTTLLGLRNQHQIFEGNAIADAVAAATLIELLFDPANAASWEPCRDRISAVMGRTGALLRQRLLTGIRPLTDSSPETDSARSETLSGESASDAGESVFVPESFAKKYFRDSALLFRIFEARGRAPRWCPQLALFLRDLSSKS